MPLLVLVILSSQALIKKSRFYDTMAESLGRGLIISSGDKWRQDRKTIAPAFHFGILEEFLDAMNRHSKILVDVLKRESRQKKWLDPQSAVNNCVLDILLDTSLDWNVKSQTESTEYVGMVESMIDLIIKRIYSPWFHSSIYYLFPEGQKFWKLTQHIHDVVDQKIGDKLSEYKNKVRIGTDPKRKIFLDILQEKNLSQKDLRDQINTFVAAGHHTVGNSLSWFLYLVGLHKDVQSKLLDEIRWVFPEGKVEEVTKEHLQDLKYMDCAIKESLRLYSTIPDVGRCLSEDTVIDGYHIPEGTECIISIAAIHRDPAIYPEPERFDPDRFLPENSAGRSQFAFIPFSGGPRNCIGKRYALMEMKVILCHVLSNLTVRSLDPEDKIILVPEIVCKPLKPFRIVFEPRDISS